jgi:hypothetical protein
LKNEHPVMLKDLQIPPPEKWFAASPGWNGFFALDGISANELERGRGGKLESKIKYHAKLPTAVYIKKSLNR